MVSAGVLVCTAVMFAQLFDFSEEVIPCELPDGSCVVTVVREGALNRSLWLPEEENPPVSARKALALAEKEKERVLRGVRGGNTRWVLNSINLTPAGRNRWYWEVEYHGYPPGGMTGRPYVLIFVVLMDGRLVKPKKMSCREAGGTERGSW